MIVLAPLSLPAPDAPIRIHQVKGALSIDATVGGVAGRFLISTAFGETYVRSDLVPGLTPDDSGTVEVSIGGVRVGRALPRTSGGGTRAGTIGTIGAECLREFAVGIDIDADELRLWPRDVARSVPEAWMRGARRRRGS